MTDPAPDAIVVGTGMGGATAGYALARKGMRVLFLEKGIDHLHDPDALRGDYAERHLGRGAFTADRYRDILRQSGRYWEEVLDTTSGRGRPFVPFLGSGAGGSSALYGGVMLRLLPEDFTPRRFHPDADGRSLPDRWPITLADLKPHYAVAEALYVGEHPAAEPPAELMSVLRSKGLSPYATPRARDGRLDCQDCVGFLCRSDCKKDAGRRSLLPALVEHGARLLDECTVRRLEATRERVTAVHCLHRGQALALRAPVVVLAAGALETPRILLESRSPDWPDGLANDSGLVGRNLMRHFVDFYELVGGPSARNDTTPVGVTVPDYYAFEGTKLGILQFGGDGPPAAAVLAVAQYRLLRQLGSWAASLAGYLEAPLERFLEGDRQSACVFASVMEDLPWPDNRVMVKQAGGPLCLEYHLHPYEKARIREFRRLIAERFRPYGLKRAGQARNNQLLAHVCGTCRFGSDPETSVLSPENRAHGLQNLYVVDASFFPSSGGVPPALTVAANALRVADIIAR